MVKKCSPFSIFMKLLCPRAESFSVLVPRNRRWDVSQRVTGGGDFTAQLQVGVSSDKKALGGVLFVQPAEPFHFSENIRSPTRIRADDMGHFSVTKNRRPETSEVVAIFLDPIGDPI